ncbi:hypothetical protein V8C37DRAFT_381488 [Trichoderma ceciliae]
MRAQAAIALVAGLLAQTAAAQSTPLGDLTFRAPQCGDGILEGINAADCNTAVSQLLAENCSAGVCSIPAATQGAQASVISVLVGRCEASVAAFASGKAVTVSESSLQNAFPGFITKCLAPSSGFGNPMLLTTDGVIRLVLSNGIQGGG